MQTTHRVYYLEHPFWCFRSTPSFQLTVTHPIDCDPRSSTTRRLRVSARPRTHAHAPQAIKGHVTTLACGQVFPFMPPLSLQLALLARLIYSNPHLLCSVCCYLFTIDFFFWPLILILALADCHYWSEGAGIVMATEKSLPRTSHAISARIDLSKLRVLSAGRISI